ncbi:MAG: metallophosphoesterase family protein [Isosphaeraceae bacterium]
MRIGIIADIHGDMRALESTLGRLECLAVTEIVCLGDLVGYGSEPDAVVTEIRDRGIACVRGNHDRWALERKQLFGLRGWKTAALRDETWSFLASLPPSRLVACSDTLIELHHASPSSDTEFVTAYKPMPPSVEEFWERSKARILLLGHTHIPMINRGPCGTVINPGSILSVSGIQTSYSFAVLDTECLSVHIYEVRTGREIRRDPIDLDEK